MRIGFNFFSDVWALKPNMTLLDEDTNYYSPVYVNDPAFPQSCAEYSRFCTFTVFDGDGGLMETVCSVTILLYAVVLSSILL